MERETICTGMTRVRLHAEDAGSFRPVAFRDRENVFLAQTGFACAIRPVYRPARSGAGKTRQTANGEVSDFDAGEKALLRESHSAQLRFSCPGGSVLTGLGQHEEGVFDYTARKEYLYQHNMKIAVPFLLSGAGWGLWLENGCAMRYEGHGDGFTFFLDAAEEVSYVVIRGKDCAEVLRKLSLLTGKPALLPKWAYGYIQSKERYHSAAELTETAAEFRRRSLGLDCIVLDWLSWQEGCWGDKKPDPGRFPDIRTLTETLHGMNVRLMVSVWPNMEKGRDRDEFEEAGLFLPASRIYDAFSAEGRELYWQQCRRYWMDGGTDALWCDSCEPITDPDWCGAEKRDEEERMRLVTEAASLRMDPERMNAYGTEHLRGLWEHWRRDVPDRRPVLLARSGGPESAAYGAILWSGDTSARWDVLRKQVTEAVCAACSGIHWWTLDIGAFFAGRGETWFWRGDYPEGVKDPAYRELYIRWFQFGAMLPVFRSHGTDTPREPWRFGGEDSPEYACIRDVIRLRYRLMPYLYSAAAKACRDGLPMLRAMLAAFPEEKELAGIHDQYMLGDALLVKPVTRPLQDGGNRTEVRLPRGGWYGLFDGRYVPGGGTVRMDTPQERFPVFIRAGGILPLAEGACCAAEAEIRELRVFCGADGKAAIYDDEGDGFREGWTVPVSWQEADRTLRLGIPEGQWKGTAGWKVVFCFPDGRTETQTVRYDGTAKCLRAGAAGGGDAGSGR